MTRRHFLGTTLAALAQPALRTHGATTDSFEIGLVADAQYADVPPKGTRFYRESVARLGVAVDHFNGRNLAFCAHLGDLIDRSWDSFDAIERPLATSRHPWHQVLGNHDFDVLESYKPQVPVRLRVPQRYRFFEYRDFVFVILDTNDVSTYAHAAGSPEQIAAQAELTRLQAAGAPQAKPWNGGIGPAQLAWLDQCCREARTAGRKVIIFAHHPVFPAGGHTIWNAPEVLALLSRHRNVVAWLNGHNHAGAFATHEGVPFLTLRGMVETANTSAFATAQLLPDRMLITGHGREPSREMIFRV
jgi:3',5'-cyclic AMP phosphodiesterase CpdA